MKLPPFVRRLIEFLSVGRNALWLAAVAALLLWIPLVTGLDFPSKADELTYHVPNIERFVDHFPTLAELRETNLAMGPFFHGVMGRLARWTGAELPRLRLWMVFTGLVAVGLYAALSARVPGVDGRATTIVLAAFPYFGATYFTVMTDCPAFLWLVATWLGQLSFVQTGRERALWLASVSALLACLVRHNLVFVPGVFLLFVLIPGMRSRNAPGPAAVPWWRLLPALALPFAAIGVRVWLWGGLLPPGAARVDFLEGDLRIYALALVSIGANIGYYLLPATAAFALAQRRGRTYWAILAGVGLGVTAVCYVLRGPMLVTTFGSFLHGLTFLRVRFGLAASLVVFCLSIASFASFAVGAWTWMRHPGPDANGRRLLGGLLAGAFLVLGFGMFRIYERYILPAYALTVLIAFAASGGGARLRWAGAVGTVAFGLVHEVLYALDVYELTRR